MKPRLVIVGLLSGAFWLVLAGLLGAGSTAAAASPLAPAAGATITVTTALDDFTVNGNCSLREAIEAANTNAAVDACPAGTGADTIRLPRQTYSLKLTGGESTSGTVNSTADLDILGSVTLLPVACGGPVCAAPIIQAGAGWSHRLVQVTGAYSVTLSGLVLQGGNSTGAAGGGALLNVGAEVALVNTNIYSSTAAHNGGGLDNEGGSLSLTGATVRGNTASGDGAGIYNNGSLTLNNSSVTRNTNDGVSGGGIFSQSGPVTLNNTTLATNTAVYAGGMLLNGGSLVMTNGALQGNTAVHSPGGLAINAPVPATLTGVTVRGNTVLSEAVGGILMSTGASLTLTNAALFSNSIAIDNGGGRLTVRGTTISGNSGNGIVSSNGQTTISNTTISGNSALGNGGGVYGNGGVMLVSGSTLANNHATSIGGGLYAANGLVLTVISSTLSGNSTAEDGGGLGVEGLSTMVGITGSAILSNTSVLFGGGISDDGELVLVNSTVSGNSSNSDGGGISVGTEASLSNVTIANNLADKTGATSEGGGGIAGAQVFFQNTLIAGNQDNQPGTKAPDCAVASMTSYGYNLIQNITGCGLRGIGTGNITGLPAHLGPAQNNGGPTFTQALLAGSPAIDTGDNVHGCQNLSSALLLTSDQRGQPRPQGTACDIGAYESALTVVFLKLYLPLVQR